MRVALLGSGSPQSLAALGRLRAAADVVAVVVPRTPHAAPLAAAGGRETLEFGDGLASELRARQVERLCVASFPHLLRGELLTIPALNVHMSLLPRHRGSDPLFWTYYCGDAEAGVTIHRIDEGWDTGPIVLQQSLPLPRAMPSREVYMQLAATGAELLVQSLTDEHSTRQNESLATHETAPQPGKVRIDYGSWPVTRAWHFLAGMSDQRRDLIEGHPHGRAIEYREGTPYQPGSILRTRNTIEVQCRDGVVVMERVRNGLLRRIIRGLTR